MSQLAGKNKLRTAIQDLIANQVLNTQCNNQILKHFLTLDTNGDGRLSKEQLIDGYGKFLGDILQAQQKVEAVINDLDQDGQGRVDFTELMMTCLNMEKILTKDRIEEAFKLIDLDGNGQITRSELEDIMDGLLLNQQKWNALLNQCDLNQDGMICLGEFCFLLVNLQDLFNISGQ